MSRVRRRNDPTATHFESQRKKKLVSTINPPFVSNSLLFTTSSCKPSLSNSLLFVLQVDVWLESFVLFWLMSIETLFRSRSSTSTYKYSYVLLSLLTAAPCHWPSNRLWNYWDILISKEDVELKIKHAERMTLLLLKSGDGIEFPFTVSNHKMRRARNQRSIQILHFYLSPSPFPSPPSTAVVPSPSEPRMSFKECFPLPLSKGLGWVGAGFQPIWSGKRKGKRESIRRNEMLGHLNSRDDMMRKTLI